jgi:AbiV family abortive infection protein
VLLSHTTHSLPEAAASKLLTLFTNCREGFFSETAPAVDKIWPDNVPHTRGKMVSRHLDKYKGGLFPEQIAEGMNAATKNAVRLTEDANLLLERGRFPSAASLAILAIEEAGKVSILLRLAVSRDGEEIAKCWREYRSHTKKNVMWLLPQLLAQGSRYLEDFRPLFDEEADHPFLLDQVKQIGFYTDCLGEEHWSIPHEVIDEPLARMLVRIAGMVSKDRVVTPKEIELWVKHMEPVWMTDLDGMKRALIDWYDDMQQLGLASGSYNEMEEFVYGVSEGGFPKPST